MATSALLALVIIIFAFNHEQLKTNLFYRFKVFAIVGIANFCISYYVVYLCKISGITGFVVWVIAAVIVITSCLICLTPAIKKDSFATLTLIAALALFSAAGIFVFDTSIKNLIARSSGYFTEGTFAFSQDSSLNSNDISFDHPSSYYSIRIPQSWEIKRLPTGEQYFIYSQGKDKSLEFRPKCISGLSIDYPTLVINTEKTHNSSAQNTHSECHETSKGIECIVKSRYENKQTNERWHWFFMPNSLNKNGVEFDILFFENNEELYKQARSVLSTVDVKSARSETNDRESEPHCSTPSAWF